MLSHRSVLCVAVGCLAMLVYGTSLAEKSGFGDSPREAAREVLEALAVHDADRLGAAMHVESPAHQPLVEAMAQMLVAGRKLGDTATARFGPSGAALIADGVISPSDAQEIEQARVETPAGDLGPAEVYLPGQTLPLRFVRDNDGRWKLSVAHYHGGQAANLDRQAALLRLMASAMGEAAMEIEQDRYADAASAEAAIKQKLNFVLMRSLTDPSRMDRSTTVPATQPAR